jgi:hypothetical protein
MAIVTVLHSCCNAGREENNCGDEKDGTATKGQRQRKDDVVSYAVLVK